MIEVSCSQKKHLNRQNILSLIFPKLLEMSTTAIIVNYHTSSFLPPLLEVLNTEPEISEIIVADNSAELGLTEVVKGFSKVQLMVFSQNIGFAAAVNRAAENCDSNWYLIINPDTMPEPGFVEKLLRGAQKMDALIAGPRFFWDNEKKYKLPPALGNSWWMQAGMEAANNFKLDAKLLGFYWDLRFDRYWKEAGPFYEPFLSGACLLIKNDKTFFRNGKIFDERFFLYYEDTDLCVKAMMNDLIMVCVPDAHVVHYWNQSPSQQKGRFMTESHDRFWQKYYPGMSYTIVIGKGFKESFTDFGAVNHSPRFEIDSRQNSGILSFEIGVNPAFVPYAQTDVQSSLFEIPPAVWHAMAPGLYFGRIRNSLNETITRWKWKKQ